MKAEPFISPENELLFAQAQAKDWRNWAYFWAVMTVISITAFWVEVWRQHVG